MVKPSAFDPTPEVRTSRSIGERLGSALRWCGLTLVSAPFVLSLVWIVATRILGWMPGEIPISYYGLVPLFVGGLGALPFFLLVPWLTAEFPWFDRSVPGALALSALLSIPTTLAPLVVWDGFAPEGAVWSVAFGAIAAPRLIAKSLRIGTFVCR